MKKKYTFRSMLKDRDLYLGFPGRNGQSAYRLIKPQAEFTIECNWESYLERYITQGLVALVGIDDIPPPATPESLLNVFPPQGKKYRSIDDL